MNRRKKLVRDAVLASILLAVCGAALLIWHGTADKGDIAVVTVDGREVGAYPLSEDTEVTIVGVGGENVLKISGGMADITDADCPDKICADHRPIENAGETIVCLPHKVVVKIVSEKDDGVDMAA